MSTAATERADPNDSSARRGKLNVGPGPHREEGSRRASRLPAGRCRLVPLVPVPQAVANHAPEEKNPGHQEHGSGTVAEEDEGDAPANHGDPHEVTLPRGSLDQGLSNEWACAVGHQSSPVVRSNMTCSLLDRLSITMTNRPHAGSRGPRREPALQACPATRATADASTRGTPLTGVGPARTAREPPCGTPGADSPAHGVRRFGPVQSRIVRAHVAGLGT